MKRIVPHRPEWRPQFEIESTVLLTQLGDAVVRIHHMGSTAIPGIPAKPVIDVLIEAISLTSIDDQSGEFTALEYEVRGEYGIEGRRYFSKQPREEVPAFHVHAYLAESYQVRRHLAFRDYLIENSDIALEYARLKGDLSDAYGNLKADYQAKKAPFVDATALAAMKHYEDRT